MTTLADWRLLLRHPAHLFAFGFGSGLSPKAPGTFGTLVALPLGCLAGYGLAAIMLVAFETELYRIPMALEMSTLGMAVLITLAATVVSAFVVRRRLDHLDLIAVLKTRE